MGLLSSVCVWKGTWGTSDRDEYERTQQRDVFGPTSKLSLQIDEIANDFNQRFVTLLDMVKERPAGYVPTCLSPRKLKPGLLLLRPKSLLTGFFTCCTGAFCYISGSQSLPFLVSRFDFNEYYRNKMAPPTDADE